MCVASFLQVTAQLFSYCMPTFVSWIEHVVTGKRKHDVVDRIPGYALFCHIVHSVLLPNKKVKSVTKPTKPFSMA